MIKRLAAGHDASAGTYRCVDCDHTIRLAEPGRLPVCPKSGADHRSNQWEVVSDEGEPPEDPHPDAEDGD